mgnify:CR=1 FL=1
MGTKRVSTQWVLALTSLGFFMSMMDSMIVTTASTAIRRDFHISVTSLQWTLNAYNVTIAAVLLIGVALGEHFGRRRIYSLGILVFTLGSVLCALAPTIGWLIFARVVAGLGASVMTPMSMAILTHTISPAKRGSALGIWGGIGGLALIIGPSLGGLIVAKLTWPWIFWINVPIGLLAVGLGQRYLPESRGDVTPIHGVDVVTIIGSLTGLVLALNMLTSMQRWPGALALLGVSLGLGVLVHYRQTRLSQPLISFTVFQSRSYLSGNLATFLSYASMYGVVFFLPQFFQIVGGANAAVAGLEILPWTATLVMVAPFAGKAVDKWGDRRVAITGLLLQGVGYGWLAGLAPLTTYSGLIGPLILAGSGLSMAGPALQKGVLGAGTPALVGQASGVYNVFRLLGGAVGTTAAVIVFGCFGRLATANSFMPGFQATMGLASSLAILGAAVTFSWFERQ